VTKAVFTLAAFVGIIEFMITRGGEAVICTACPRKCKAERIENRPSKGFCGMPYNAVLARAALHKWEEPVISGENGSGAIFFSGCSMKCVYCQNYELSHLNFGKPVSRSRFIEIVKELEAAGAHNINLVNPTHFTPFLREALQKYKPSVPVVYNSGGYDSVESLKALEGLIDIYMPDIKYFDSAVSAKYSSAPDYFSVASKAVLEMKRQCPEDKLSGGIMKSGLLIRHLVLPGQTDQSFKILKWISENLPKETYLSIMNQYTPCFKAAEHKEINRRTFTAEYDKVIDEFFALGLKNGFMQERTSAKNTFIPKFDLTGV